MVPAKVRKDEKFLAGHPRALRRIFCAEPTAKLALMQKDIGGEVVWDVKDIVGMW
jgi:hypothetical protein